MVTLSLVEEITSALERDLNATRIKKLLVCACRRQWLNDQAALARLSWQELLLELYHAHASLDQLSETLFAIVQQLNRKAEYAQVASVLLTHCESLYSDPTETTQFLAAEADSTQLLTPPPDAYAEVVAQLDSHPEVQRLRKLLYCAHYSEWQSNRDLLAQLNWADLLASLVARYSSPEYLAVVLNGIVQNLSRRDPYANLVATLLELMTPLYGIEAVEATEGDTGLLTAEGRAPSTRVTQALADVTEAIAPIPTSVTVNQADQPTAVLPQRPRVPTAQGGDDTTGYTPTNTATDFNGTPQFSPPAPSTPPTYDPFQVRLAVMKYANPLRAKILAFSTLHHKFEVTGNEWSSMRTRPLDDLLAQLYETYQRLGDLETELQATAKCLGAPEEDDQAAVAIVKALEPLYRDRTTVPIALAQA